MCVSVDYIIKPILSDKPKIGRNHIKYKRHIILTIVTFELS